MLAIFRQRLFLGSGSNRYRQGRQHGLHAGGRKIELAIPFHPEASARRIGLADASGYDLHGFPSDAITFLDRSSPSPLSGWSIA